MAPSTAPSPIDGNGSSDTTSWRTIVLPTVIETLQIAPIRDQLVTLLQDRQVVKIDARDVCRISTAAIQVLVAATAAFSGSGLKIYYADPSDEFIEAFSDLGLYTHLADYIEISS